MSIYYIEECDTSKKKLSETELIRLGKNCKKFLAVYSKLITIKDVEQADVLRRIDYISTLILNRQYQEIFDNPMNEINFDLGELSVDDIYDVPWD